MDNINPGIQQQLMQSVASGSQNPLQDPVVAVAQNPAISQSGVGGVGLVVDPSGGAGFKTNETSISTGFSSSMLANWGAVRDPGLQGLKHVTMGNPVSMGDAILRGIGQVSANYRTQLEGLRASLLNIPTTSFEQVANFYSVQFKITQFSLSQEMASKMASKMAQGIQTLFNAS
jgi:hypothetical protein